MFHHMSPGWRQASGSYVHLKKITLGIRTSYVLEIGSVRERAHKTKLQDYAPGWTVDGVTDGFVAFDAAKALIDSAVAAVCGAKVGRCVYDFARYQTIHPLDRVASYSVVTA
jgi:hypothetical protein